MRNERTGRSKADSAFLQSLNSRLAEQAMSGKAFAVRNLINSKALVRSPPDQVHVPNTAQKPNY